MGPGVLTTTMNKQFLSQGTQGWNRKPKEVGLLPGVMAVLALVGGMAGTQELGAANLS